MHFSSICSLPKVSCVLCICMQTDEVREREKGQEEEWRSHKRLTRRPLRLGRRLTRSWSAPASSSTPYKASACGSANGRGSSSSYFLVAMGLAKDQARTTTSSRDLAWDLDPLPGRTPGPGSPIVTVAIGRPQKIPVASGRLQEIPVASGQPQDILVLNILILGPTPPQPLPQVPSKAPIVPTKGPLGPTTLHCLLPGVQGPQNQVHGALLPPLTVLFPATLHLKAAEESPVSAIVALDHVTTSRKYAPARIFDSLPEIAIAHTMVTSSIAHDSRAASRPRIHSKFATPAARQQMNVNQAI